MLNSVLTKTLRDKRKTFLWWGLGVTLLLIWYSLMFSSIEGDLSGINQMMESELIKGLLGGSHDLTTPEGWLGAELLPLLGPLIFIVFAVSFATSELTGEEEEGTLDLLLSNPISRTKVLVNKFLAMVLGTTAMGVVFWFGNIIGTSVANMGIPFLSLAQVSFSLVLLGLLFGTLALALGSLTGKRGVCVGVASAVGIASYLLNSMAEIIQGLKPYRPLSVFHYYDGAEVLKTGINPTNAGILLASTVVLFLIGLYGFRRRDIGT